MRHAVAAKERHICSSKWNQPFIKGQERGFARKNIADEHRNKIDEVVLVEPSTSEADLLLNLGETSRMGKDLSKSGNFACAPCPS